jgi:hypothetical protein
LALAQSEEMRRHATRRRRGREAAGPDDPQRQAGGPLRRELKVAKMRPGADDLPRTWRSTADALGGEPVRRLLREKQAKLLADKKPLAAVRLAWRSHQMGEPALADESLRATVDSARDDERGLVRLAGREFLWPTGQFGEALPRPRKALDINLQTSRGLLLRLLIIFIIAPGIRRTHSLQDVAFNLLPRLVRLLPLVGCSAPRTYLDKGLLIRESTDAVIGPLHVQRRVTRPLLRYPTFDNGVGDNGSVGRFLSQLQAFGQTVPGARRHA